MASSSHSDNIDIKTPVIDDEGNVTCLRSLCERLLVLYQYISWILAIYMTMNEDSVSQIALNL